MLLLKFSAVLTAFIMTAHVQHRVVPHKPFGQMTTHQRIDWLKRQIHKDRSVILFWRNHRYLATVHHDFAYENVRWARVSLQIATKNLAKLVGSGSWPPHHLLWVCIGRHEGGVHSVNPNGHYGMLQMHANWGYGTSTYASDDSQQVQEWAAERAYRASGYSRSFLFGQWLNYDGATECLSDA